jgi:hypothetical protein
MFDLLLGLVLTALLLRAAAYLPERARARDIRPGSRRSAS